MRAPKTSALIDLHMHTTCSDGVWSSDRLLSEIDERGIEYFAITDHDSLDAYPLPRQTTARCIQGLEVDSHHGGHTVHLLAYGVSAGTPLLAAIQAQRDARTERMSAMLEAMRKRGVDVSMDEIYAQAGHGANLGRPHLARVLVVRGVVATVQEAFDRYLADDAAAYVALERLTSREIIALVRESGGVSVVAHPARLRTPAALRELLDLGVDGIEIAHHTADAAIQAELTEIARGRGCLVTGGTDFHEPVAGRPIGVAFERSEVERLLEAIAERAATMTFSNKV